LTEDKIVRAYGKYRLGLPDDELRAWVAYVHAHPDDSMKIAGPAFLRQRLFEEMDKEGLDRPIYKTLPPH
jgi:hypothetical protein